MAVAGISAHRAFGSLEAETRLGIVGVISYEGVEGKQRGTGEIGRLEIHLGALREEIHVAAHVVLWRIRRWVGGGYNSDHWDVALLVYHRVRLAMTDNGKSYGDERDRLHSGVHHILRVHSVRDLDFGIPRNGKIHGTVWNCYQLTGGDT